MHTALILPPHEEEDKPVSLANNAQETNEFSPLKSSIVVFAARYYICAAFCVYCLMQCSMWIFYSPIQQPLKTLYGWSDTYIQWLGNFANIFFCLLAVPIAAWVDTRGLRAPLLVTVVALCLNAGLRCLPYATMGSTGFAATSMASMGFNGVAGTVEAFAPPVVSALWFPVSERATATAVMASANSVGMAAGFLTAFVVPENGTPDEISSALTKVYWSMFIICIALLMCIILYFPDRPPSPPSYSSLVHKMDVRAGLGLLLRHGRFWLIVAAMALPLGVFNAWLLSLDLILKDFKFSQSNAGWIGFSASLAGGLAGIVVSRIADRVPGYLTKLIAVMYFAAAAFMTWFTLMCVGVLPFNLSSVYFSAIAFGFCMYGTYPLFFELCIESTFPIPEGVTSAFLVMTQSASQTSIGAIPIALIGSQSFSWMLCFSPALFGVMLLFFEDDYIRLTIDLKNEATALEHDELL